MYSNTRKLYPNIWWNGLVAKITENIKNIWWHIRLYIKGITSSLYWSHLFVTDYYLEDSIKSMERDLRSAYGTIRMKVMRREQVISKQWKKILWNSENKLDLIDFLWHDWLWSTKLKHSQQLDGKELYMTLRDEAHCISSVHSVITRPFQERRAIACAYAHTRRKAIKSVVNFMHKSNFWLHVFTT